MIMKVVKKGNSAPNFQHKNGLPKRFFVSLSSPCAALEYNKEYVYTRNIFSTDLNRTIVCRSFLPFKITWLHLPGFVVELAKLLRIIAIAVNIKRLATFVSHTFQLTFKLIGNISFVDDVIK